MRPNTPNTDSRRGERGQALVLVAMMVVVLIGFIGLAIDGGRLYWERRILQNSVDAAALAASDNYQDSLSISSSLRAAATEYAANEKIYGTASASPSWTASTVDVTWTGSTDTMHVVYTAAGTVSAFDVSSVHQIPLAFMPVLGSGASANVQASAEGHAKTGGTAGAALVTLGTNGCGGVTGTSLSVQGATTKISVTGGNIQSNGSVIAAGSGISVNGNFADNCTSPVPAGVTATGTKTSGVAPVSDPAFSSGPLASYSTPQTPTTNIVLNPGVYAADPATGGSGCYFMTPGIYQFNGGINASSLTMSNQLRPPDEAAWQGSPTNAPNYVNAVASPQYWPTACAGSFTVSAVTSLLPLTLGSWGAVVTSTRTETYPPGSTTNYPRESAPSTCHSVNVSAAQALQVKVNNVPGATGYNVYLAYAAVGGDACTNGLWGYVGSLTNSSTEVYRSMGSVTSPVYDTTVVTAVLTPATISKTCTIGTTYTFGCAAPTGGFGAANPPGDGAETAPLYSTGPPGPPARDIASAGGGDRANEHDCQVSNSTSSAAPCTNVTVTPGAVQAYFPAGACLTTSGASNLAWFAGLQFNMISIYAPTANTCTVSISGRASFGPGAVYWPGGNWTVSGNGGAPIASQVIVNTFTANGNGTLSIAFDQQASPAQGYSQLSL